MPSTTTDRLIRESEQAYDLQRRNFLTSHALADFRKCPRYFRDRELDLIPNEDRPAFLVGRATHVLALEGRDAYSAVFGVGGPINEKTCRPFGRETKAFAEWAAEQDKEILTGDQAALVEQMAASVRAHPVAKTLLAEGMPEGVVRADYCCVPCQIRIDFLNSLAGIVDLKTCDEIDWLEADARRYGYAHQMAFYRAVLAAAGCDRLPVHLIAVEKRAPYRCGIWRFTDQILEIAARDNVAAINRLQVCRAQDSWPTGYEDVRSFDHL